MFLAYTTCHDDIGWAYSFPYGMCSYTFCTFFSASQEHENGVSDDYWNLLFSMLFLQDSLLGLFMAVLPILAGHAEKGHSFAHVPVNRALHDWFHGTFGGM